MAYTKLFQSIVTSTIWMEDDPTRILWITMLAMADKNGEVQASVPGLARMAGVSIAACEKALQTFLSPDKDSRTKVLEGRRIQEIDGGWLLVNHEKYRLMASKEESKAKAVARVQRWRENHREGKKPGENVNGSLTTDNTTITHHRDIADTDSDSDEESKIEASSPIVSGAALSSEHAPAEAVADAQDGGSAPAIDPEPKTKRGQGARLPDDWHPEGELRQWTLDEIQAKGSQVSAGHELEKFRDYWKAKAGAGGRKADWPATWRNWIRKAIADEGKPNGQTIINGSRTARPEQGRAFRSRMLLAGAISKLGNSGSADGGNDG